MKSRVLIIYYSLSGVSSKIANVLQKRLDCDIYEIKTERTYNSDMWKAWDEAQEETKSGNLPTLNGELPNTEQYDVILLGGPVWGHSLSNPLLSFVRQMNFTGKTIAAYWTFYDHDEKYAIDIAKECAGATIKASLPLPISVIHNTKKLTELLRKWLEDIVIEDRHNI